MTTDTTTDPELERLLDACDAASQSVAIAHAELGYASQEDAEAECEDARTALLKHVAARYVRRDSVNHYAYLDRLTTELETRMRRDADRQPASTPGPYTAARGVPPRRPGDELPEDARRRLRDGG